jgi:predicted TIM-barrel fold metal-dependent hydrolase
MIVDVHTHLPTHMESVPPGEERFIAVSRPDRPVRLTNSFDDYLEAMGAVDKACVFAIAPARGDKDIMGLRWPANFNDMTAALVARAPHKLIGFMSVHPEDPKALDEVERCTHDLKLRGIKLGPNYQRFDPLGGPARRLYEDAQRRRLPILFHQGTSPVQFAPLRYAHPLVMDEIAMLYPDLRIVMAHIGHPWQIDTLMVIRKHPNVYADVSAQHIRPWSFYNTFRLAWEWGVTHKLLFATDWPFTDPGESIAALKGFNAFARQHHLPEVPDTVFEEIIHRESLKLLGLESA